jgi:hypothetical protein
MKKLIRNKSTEEAAAFWAAVERGAEEARRMPQWMKVGVIIQEPATEEDLQPSPRSSETPS